MVVPALPPLPLPATVSPRAPLPCGNPSATAALDEDALADGAPHWASACCFLGLPSTVRCTSDTCAAAVQLLTWACKAVLSRPGKVGASFGVGVHAAVRAALQVLACTAQRSAGATSALAKQSGGSTLETIANDWVAEASALLPGDGVVCWPVGCSSGAAALMLERESDSSFAVTLYGGEGVEYHPQVSLSAKSSASSVRALIFARTRLRVRW